MASFPLPRLFAILLCLPICLVGCASLNYNSNKTDLSQLDTMVDEIRREPTPMVDHVKVREVSPRLEEEEELSLATLTPEKVGEQIAAGYYRMIGLDPNEAAAMASFKEGIELFDAGKYDEAAKKFKIADLRAPNTPLQEDAIFMRAESKFFAQRYAWAQTYYERLLKKYDSTRYMDRVSPRLFDIGRYWDKQDQIQRFSTVNVKDKERPTFDTYGNCLKAYKMIVLHDSRGLWADHALMAAANAEYLRGHYEYASMSYDQLIKDYPQSKHLLQACELNLSSKLLCYEGPQYDAKPLEDAEEIAQRLLSQFGMQLKPERKEAIRRTQDQIVEAKAERDMEYAKFYESKHYYGAAREYYTYVIQDYPQTATASRAKEKFDRIKDYPAEPKDYFAWLKKVFPEQ